jgi:hypothetical protein
MTCGVASVEIVQRICHVCRNNSVAFSMLLAGGSIIIANYVPSAGKAAASAFRKWDAVLRVGLNKGAQQNVWLI